MMKGEILEKFKLFFLVVGSLALGGVLSWLVFWSPHEAVTSSTSESKPADLSQLNNFQKGQYYFNHDADPAPPYDLVKAREYFELAVAEDPKDNALLWYQLGRIDFLEGKFNSALYKFDKQIEYFGGATIPNVYYMIGLTHGYKARRDGDEESWQKAAEGFRKYLEFDPESPWGRTDLAWVYFAQGKYEEMIPVLEKGLEYSPTNPWLLNMYGLALLNTDQKAAAREQFLLAREAAYVLTPTDWGRAYPGNSPDDWEQGLLEFKRAIEKNIELTS